MPNKPNKLFDNLIKKLKEIEIEPKVLHETDDERIEEYTLPVEFFDELTKFMSRSPIVAAVLEKENAVTEFRNLIGDTDPSTAKEGTIRNKYAISKGENSVHGSDSDENANIEAKFHFSGREILL